MDRKQYQKEYQLKNKEKIKEYNKEYREKHKEKAKECREKHKEKKKEYNKEYSQTEQGKKNLRINNWKYRGIIFHDFDLLHDMYLQTTHCDQCKCLLNQCEKSRKCVDHDHSITDDDNVRNILCVCCNFKRR